MAAVITQGYTSIPGTHFVLKSGGGDEAQQQCLIHGVVHFKTLRGTTSMSCTAADPPLPVSLWQLLSNSHHSEMHQDARFSGSSDTCSADPARFGVLIRLLQHQEENPGHQFALLSCLHVEGIPGLLHLMSCPVPCYSSMFVTT